MLEYRTEKLFGRVRCPNSALHTVKPFSIKEIGRESEGVINLTGSRDTIFVVSFWCEDCQTVFNVVEK